MTKYYPSAVIDVFAEVLQADAGTRTAAINAASIALADAGIPMKGLISACAVGKVDGQLVLDLSKDEDNYGNADLPIAMTQDGEISLLQMDGNLTKEEFKKALEMATEGCRQILEIQKEALKKKFESHDEVVKSLVEVAEEKFDDIQNEIELIEDDFETSDLEEEEGIEVIVIKNDVSESADEISEDEFTELTEDEDSETDNTEDPEAEKVGEKDEQ
jgi:exosome complex component RRP41